MAEHKYKRVLLKISGEALAGTDGSGISPQVIRQFAEDIKEAHQTGVQIGIVIGGGNIFRGVAASAQGMDRASSCLLYTSPSPRDQRGSRMPSSA